MTVAFILMPVMILTLPSQASKFWVSLGLLAVIGYSNQIFQSSVNGIASQMKGFYVGYFLSGSGLSGIIMNVSKIITLVAFTGFENASYIGMYTYFAIGAIIFIACVGLHLGFIQSPAYTKRNLTASFIQEHGHIESDQYMVEDPDSKGHREVLPRKMSKVEEQKFDFKLTFKVMKKNWIPVCLLLLNYIQTFMMFPGVTLMRTIPGMSFTWSSLLMVLTFNTFDTIGKYLAKYRSLFNQKCIAILTVSRFWFFFTFILGATTTNVAVVDTTVFAFVNIAMLGVTNGYVTTCCFIFGPENVKGGREQEIAGFLSVLALTSGITIGAFLALPFSHLNGN